MKEVLCDTSYFVALNYPKDPAHSLALSLAEELNSNQLILSREVIVESLNFFARFNPDMRDSTAHFFREFENQPNVYIEDLSQEGFLEALLLYEARSDKCYSLTDCVSMNLASKRGITEILTLDEHFQQEGLTALMLLRSGKRRWEKNTGNPRRTNFREVFPLSEDVDKTSPEKKLRG